MQGCNEPSFFPTKKNPAPAVEEEGRMMPATWDASYMRYISPWPPSRAQTESKGAPWAEKCQATGQSHSCTGGAEAEMKLGTYWKLLSSHGKPPVHPPDSPAPPATQNKTLQGKMQHPNIELNRKDSNPNTELRAQSIWGLYLASQVCPKTTGAVGEWMRRKQISSAWLPESVSVTNLVAWVILVRRVPQRVLADIGSARATDGSPKRVACPESMKSPFAPE